MIELALSQLGPLMLMGGYFLNGGVGLFMQPNGTNSSGPPPACGSTSCIITESGSLNIITESGGQNIVTEH